MTKIVDILEEMTTKLETAFAGLTDPLAVQVYPRRVIGPSPPTVDMYPGDPSRSEITAGFGDTAGVIAITVRARVSTNDQDEGQALLLAMMDEEDDLCVAEALMADQTLNGTTSSVFVEGPFGHTLYEDVGGKGALLGMDWRVTIVR